MDNIIIDRLKAVEPFFSTALRNSIQNLTRFERRTELIIEVLTSEQYLKNEWSEEHSLLRAHNFEFKIASANEITQVEDINRLLFADFIFVVTTAIQLLPAGLYKILEPLKHADKTLLVFLQGWELIGAQEETVTRKVQEAYSIFPIRPFLVLPVSNNTAFANNPALISPENQFNAVKNILKQWPENKPAQIKAIASLLLAQAETESGALKTFNKQLLSRLKTERSLVLNTQSLQLSQSNALSVFIRDTLSRIDLALTKLDEDRLTPSLYEIIAQSGFDAPTCISRFKEVIVDYFQAQLSAFHAMAERSTEPFQQMKNAIATEWAQNCHTFESLMPNSQKTDSRLRQLVEAGPSFHELEQILSRVFGELLASLSKSLQLFVSEQLRIEKVNLTQVIKAEQSGTESKPESRSTENQKLPGSDFFNKMGKNLLGKYSREHTLESVVQRIIIAIKEQLYAELIQLKDQLIENLEQIHQRGVRDYTEPIIKEIDAQITDYELKVQPLLNF